VLRRSGGPRRRPCRIWATMAKEKMEPAAVASAATANPPETARRVRLVRLIREGQWQWPERPPPPFRRRLLPETFAPPGSEWGVSSPSSRDRAGAGRSAPPILP